MGIEALGSVHGCVSQLLGHGNNIRSICQEDGGNGVAEGVGVDMGQIVAGRKFGKPAGDYIRAHRLTIVLSEHKAGIYPPVPVGKLFPLMLPQELHRFRGQGQKPHIWNG